MERDRQLTCDLNIQDIGQLLLIMNEIHMYNLSIIRQTKMKPYKALDGRIYYTSVEWNNVKTGKRKDREDELTNMLNTLIKKLKNVINNCKRDTKYINLAKKIIKVSKYGPTGGVWADSQDNYNNFLTFVFDGGYKFITALLNGKHPGVNSNKLIKNKSVYDLLTKILDRHPTDADIKKWEELSRGIKTTHFGKKKKGSVKKNKTGRLRKKGSVKKNKETLL